VPGSQSGRWSSKMEELERLERERYGLFALTSVICLAGFAVARYGWWISIFNAGALGFLVSGMYVARKTTSEPLWPLVLAEARLNGGTPTKSGIWLGNLLLPFVGFSTSAWWYASH
jgi:hypothetical protein